MLQRIFPKAIDNNFRGYRLAIWILGFYAFVKLGQGTKSLFDPASTAVSADGIPLDTYSPAASATVISMFTLLGLNLLVLPLQSILVMIRYRAMIPLMYLMMLILGLSGRAILYAHPSERIGGVQPAGFYVNLALLAILMLGFALSLADTAGRRLNPTG